MSISKKKRLEVYEKTNGHCYYCGKSLLRQWQVDRIMPLYKNDTAEFLENHGITRGTDDMDNLAPSCARCNHWKGTMSIITFRKQIKAQHERLLRNAPGYRLAYDMGLIQFDTKVIFYFEKERL